MSEAQTLTATRATRSPAGLLLRVAAGVLVSLAVLYLAISAYVATAGTKAQRKPIGATPDSVGLKYESLTFPSDGDGVTIAAWFIPSTSGKAIIQVHGINSNRATGEDKSLNLARDYVDLGYNMLMIDLRGHGESGGDRVGFGWYERRDVGGAVKYLEGRGFKPGSIGVHGSSYGAATALLAAAAYPDIGAVVADSPFADARDLLNEEIRRRVGLPPIFTPGSQLFAGLLYGLNYDEITPIKAVSTISPRPILFLHGDIDTRIPPEQSVRLKAADNNPGDEIWIAPVSKQPDGKENHVREYSVFRTEFLARVGSFFERNLR